MFHLIRLIIWLAGVAVVTYFVLGYLGYEVNWHYFDQSKAACQEKLNQCKRDLIHQGLDNVKCDFQCVDNPKLLIQKKS